MFDPKWGVLIVALSVFALAASFDAKLGWAVGFVLAAIAAIALYIQFRIGFRSGTSPADRARLANRYRRLGSNRRAAQAASDAAERDRRD
ncbi:MAG: hypothetical protein V2J14_09735 [Erythrobacter sp.]|nr:hypothetical protein [Erythrobacter sp.]